MRSTQPSQYPSIREFRKFFVCFVLAVFFLATLARTERRRGPIVRQVDHLLIQSGNPEGLFKFFAGTLRLPEAWPINRNQTSITAGVSTGNIILEIFGYTKTKNASARYAGVAFEPYSLAEALQELQTAGIPYDPPQPYVSILPTGKQGVAWTTVRLPTFSRPDMPVILYEYSPAFLNVAVRRKQLGNRLTLEGGGPLGLQKLIEITIASTDLEKDGSNWNRLLGTSGIPNLWRAGAGPAIKLVKGPADAIQSITFKVVSLEKAKAFLGQNRLLGTAGPNSVSLSPRTVEGLNMSLAQ